MVEIQFRIVLNYALDTGASIPSDRISIFVPETK